jgi:hypothetical protein
MMKVLPLEQQIQEAIVVLKAMFGKDEPAPPGPPKEATLQSLWEEVKALQLELMQIKKLKRGVKPKVEDAVKLMVENQALAQIPITMIAELIREVFKAYGIPSKCSESSVRWYLSQFSLEWDIVRRQLPPVRVISDDLKTSE